MMRKFCKYEGAGNDFILMDNRIGDISLDVDEIKDMCGRFKGIGADGLILIEANEGFDFYMRYYNSDGSEVGMCGNGGRCAVLFAHHLGIGDNVKHFMAKDGEHTAEILFSDEKDGDISLGLIDVNAIETIDAKRYSLNTGVPHYVEFVNRVDSIDVESVGRKISHSVKGGTNVNFCQIMGEMLVIRTYERGVEAETMACGTGAAACAIAANYSKMINDKCVVVNVLGGTLKVSFDDNYHNVILTGHARKVFKGEI